MDRRYRIEKLTDARKEDFLEYCRKHEKDHDESFLSEDELKAFIIEDNITRILIDNTDETVAGTFSIMLKREGRVRIFHTEPDTPDSYKNLGNAVLGTVKSRYPGLIPVLYIPMEKKKTIGFYKETGFVKDRTIFVLERNTESVPNPLFPNGFSLKSMRFPEDVSPWCRIRNLGMKDVKGFVEYSEDEFSEMNTEPGYLAAATLILWKEGEPIGIIRAEKDIQPEGTFGFIGPIALLPEYRGRGLGRNMLRAVLGELLRMGPWKASLCVNTDNDDALKLYMSEGFETVETVIAMRFNG